MSIKSIRKHADKIINGRMKLSPISSHIESPIYSVEKRIMSATEVMQIQEELSADNINSELGISQKKYYLKIILPENVSIKVKAVLIPIALFLLTMITMTATGAIFLGKEPFNSWQNFQSGFVYSFALATILFTHEMGHYISAKKYNLNVSLPYFIPFFFPFFHPVTLGAFIKIKSLMPNKKALFDIGVSGPIAGFIASVIVLSIGFNHLPSQYELSDYLNKIHRYDLGAVERLYLGHSLIFDWLKSVFNADYLPYDEIYHFPLIFAGWIGLMVTAINLFPIGQLDGGHISFALFGKKSTLIAYLFFLFLIILTVFLIINYNSYIWVLWVIMIFFLIRFSHSSTLDDNAEIGIVREIIGRVAFVIMIVSFSPMPVYLTT